ncbi:aspartyl-phosphate phosphatase Spo0E family protein [Virgibacillus sp. C22-A2]|uniref:Aspartyl-phosphate phosphatase Spo0E family protein n=1 Tax=Virgibacillus tibetensis TaxID=3042313 RepID=A0ABU6KJQ7_9BACI|nr:aspartyl-phosphate phosphatase Spo0E family protein [Virgibacillus sp. C22-A2]
MSIKKSIENQIEQLRHKMYQAYQNEESYNDLIHISQKLDVLLNELEHLNNHTKK